jgi:hypothetical protein
LFLKKQWKSIWTKKPSINWIFYVFILNLNNKIYSFFIYNSLKYKLNHNKTLNSYKIINFFQNQYLSWYGTSSELPISLATYNIFLTFLKLLFKSLILSSKDNLFCIADGNISYRQSKYCTIATYSFPKA